MVSQALNHHVNRPLHQAGSRPANQVVLQQVFHQINLPRNQLANQLLSRPVNLQPSQLYNRLEAQQATLLSSPLLNHLHSPHRHPLANLAPNQLINHRCNQPDPLQVNLVPNLVAALHHLQRISHQHCQRVSLPPNHP